MPVTMPNFISKANSTMFLISTRELAGITGLTPECFEKYRYLTNKTGVQHGPKWLVIGLGTNGVVRYTPQSINDWLAERFDEGQE